MSSWIITSNIKKVFDLREYLFGDKYEKKIVKRESVDWKLSGHANIQIGDTVFIYITSPTQQIKYKMKVIKIGIDGNNYLEDQKFWRNGFQNNNDLYNQYKNENTFFRIKFIEELKDLDIYKLPYLTRELHFNPRKPITQI